MGSIGNVLKLGSIVHFVDSDSIDRAAIVIGVHNSNYVDLAVFDTDLCNFVSKASTVLLDATGLTSRSWHWPED